jgi:hypothetical protein
VPSQVPSNLQSTTQAATEALTGGSPNPSVTGSTPSGNYTGTTGPSQPPSSGSLSPGAIAGICISVIFITLVAAPAYISLSRLARRNNLTIHQYLRTQYLALTSPPPPAQGGGPGIGVTETASSPTPPPLVQGGGPGIGVTEPASSRTSPPQYPLQNGGNGPGADKESLTAVGESRDSGGPEYRDPGAGSVHLAGAV